MRIARVYTNETCSQNCSFCNTRRPAERPSLVAPRAVRARIDAASRAARTVVLTGGEPTMRRDLPELVRHAAATGVEVELETHAALIGRDLARALAEAGLSVARIHLPAWSGRCDDITRDPGGFDAARAGMDALAEAGVALEVSTPVVRDNLDEVHTMPEHLATDGLPVRALVLTVPVEAEDRSTLAPLPAAARVIEATESAARRCGVPLRLDAHTHVAPCLFRDVARVAHLFTMTPGGARREGYVHAEACARCSVRDRCPGLPRASVAETSSALAPIREDRLRRRLSVISTVEDQIARELYQDEIHRRPGMPVVTSRTVRINFRCNQTCRFCFVSTHLPSAPDAAVRDAIVEAATAGNEVVLSGGEPTLHPELVSFVRLARAAGAPHVELQTNATRLAEGDLVASLKEAGVDQLFISLHGSRAEISDAVTGAPGTFDKTVRGIDRAIAAEMRVRLNFVFCAVNLADFPAYVDMVSTRWPSAEITTSFVAASTDVVPRTEDLVPRYAEVIPHLASGLRLAAERGVVMSGFDSMCGIPLCLVPADISSYFELADVPAGFDRGEVAPATACRGCDLRGKCFGLRRGYAELHGTAELRPVVRDPR